VVAENDRSVEMEKEAIETQCRKLKVMIKEIEPDGHWCVHRFASGSWTGADPRPFRRPRSMFSAVADQVNFLKLSVRRDFATLSCCVPRAKLLCHRLAPMSAPPEPPR